MTTTNYGSVSRKRRAPLAPFMPDPSRFGAHVTRGWIFLGVSLFCFIWGFGFALVAPNFILFFASPPVLLSFLVFWALPDRRNAPVNTLAWLVNAFMITLIMWPNYLAFAPPGLPWITPLRMVSFLLVIILLYCTSVSKEFRVKIQEVLNESPVISWLFIAYIALSFLSIAFSARKVATLNSFINAQLSWTCIFYASLYVFQKAGRVNRTIGILCWMTLPIGLISCLEARLHHPVWAGHIPSFMQIDDPAVRRMMGGVARYGEYRVAATFPVSLGLAEYLSLMLPFIATYAIGPYRLATRLSAAIAIPFALFIIVLTGSRLGLVGSFIALALTAVLSAAMAWRRNPKSIIGPAVVIASPVTLTVVYASTFFVSFMRHAVWNGGGASASTEGRKIQTALAVPKVLHQPWGYGMGSAAEVVGFITGDFVTLDSYYIEIMVDYGPVGFVVYFGMFIYATIRAVMSFLQYLGKDKEILMLRPLIVSLVTFLIIKSVYNETSNHSIIFMVLAMILVLINRVRHEKKEESSPIAVDKIVKTPMHHRMAS